MAERIRNRLKEIEAEMRALEREARLLVVGQRIRITNGYNGQPYGQSRPALTDREFTVRSVAIDGNGCAVLPEGQRLYVDITGVAFEDDDAEA